MPTPNDCPATIAREVINRNAARQADPAFAIDGVSTTGLHYSWTWPISDSCRVHFVHLNLFPGHTCGSASNPNGEGPAPGILCNREIGWPEDSLGFVESDLAQFATDRSTMVVTIQHYGFDDFSNTWYNADQRMELMATLQKYNTLAVLVGHTHSAAVYSYNGTHQGVWGSNSTGYLDIINAPATQKEDGKENPLPSEFMVLEAALDSSGVSGTFRVAQRLSWPAGSSWGSVLGQKSFTCQ